ncbi:hypothetical protein DLM46_30320 [Paraburkholderia lacunae]|uniref:Uncharacterized protein n=1 Tax=Paraburkholderia lacunae TaxID=2211104 RepID=A0A370N0E3_9BURK|nr:hypothetical protein [Paraburkholderia lacunae]RDJ99083.1 hypothetical protein DLM46_30320 [Paraburkholderia lacunae]
MAAAEKSLRVLVDRWFGATGGRVVRVQLRRLPGPTAARCICVEAQRPAGTLTVFFFRHNDGSWHVFPPETIRPAMSLDRLAA